jgi:hypothetical protein
LLMKSLLSAIAIVFDSAATFFLLNCRIDNLQ